MKKSLIALVLASILMLHPSSALAADYPAEMKDSIIYGAVWQGTTTLTDGNLNTYLSLNNTDMPVYYDLPEPYTIYETGLKAQASSYRVWLVTEDGSRLQVPRSPDAGYLFERVVLDPPVDNVVRIEAITTSATDLMIYEVAAWGVPTNPEDPPPEMPDDPEPTTPGGLKASIQSDSIKLSWYPVDGASYRLYRDGTLLAETLQTSYTDTDVSPGVMYTYQVSSIIDGEESALSSEVRAKISEQGLHPGNFDLDVLDVVQTAWNWLKKYSVWIILALGLYFGPWVAGFLIHMFKKYTTKSRKGNKQVGSAVRIKDDRQGRKNTSASMDVLSKTDKRYAYLDKYGYNRPLTDRERAALDAMRDDPLSNKKEMEAWRKRYRDADATYDRLTRAGRIKERDMWARANRYVRPEYREAWTRSDRPLEYRRNGRVVRGR